MKRWKRIVLGLILPVLVIVGYAVWTSSSQSPYFPPLEDIANRFKDLWLFDKLGTDVLPSLLNLVVGLAAAVVAGLFLGLVLGRIVWLRAAFIGLLHFGRSVPPIMLIPPLVLVLGVGDISKVAIIAFGALFPVCLATIDGIRQTEPTLVDMARSIKLGRLATIRHVYLPAASPSIYGGAQISLQVAFVLMVASEMLAAYRGLGYITMQAQLSFDSRTMWAGIVLLALLGYVTSVVFNLIRKRALRWHAGMTRAESN